MNLIIFKNEREPTLLVLMVTNEVGSFSKSTQINEINGKHFLEKTLALINNFNKSTKPDELWSPAILTLGLSATKFNDLNKPTSKPNIQKYFMNAEKMRASTSASSIVNLNSDSTDLTTTSNADLSEFSDQQQQITEPKSEETKIIDESPNCDTRERSRLASLFENESENEVVRSDLTDADISVCDDENEADDEERQKNLQYDEVDYVKCMKCFKRILCWHMPEHEDFHYAQEVSYRLAASSSEQTTTTTVVSTANRKRSIENESVRGTQSSNKSSNNNSNKKFKKQQNDSKENNKLDKYFAVFKS